MTALPTNFTTGSTLSAAQFNATNAAINAIATGGAAAATVATSETTTSTTYADLTTTTDSVAVTVGASGLLLVSVGATAANNTNGGQVLVGFALSGANALAAADINSAFWQSWIGGAVGGLSKTVLVTGLTAGSTVVKMKYTVANGGNGSGTATIYNRVISAVPL
jgi:hypothetical protein